MSETLRAKLLEQTGAPDVREIQLEGREYPVATTLELARELAAEADANPVYGAEYNGLTVAITEVEYEFLLKAGAKPPKRRAQ